MTFQDTKDKLAQHFSDNKRTYIACGCVFALTTAAGIVAVKMVKTANPPVNISVVGDNAKVAMDNSNVIVTELVRRGHPGIKVKDLTTGMVYPSIRYAAEQTGLSRSNIMKCLSGAVSSVDGHAFVSLGDMI